jgi:hypothetical protein
VQKTLFSYITKVESFDKKMSYFIEKEPVKSI